MTTKQAEKTGVEKQTRKKQKQERNTAAKKSAKKNEQASATSTTEKQTRKEQKRKQKEEKRSNRRPRLRIFPIWLRVIVVLLFCAAALIAGLMIGYGVIGDGTPSDALKKDTWQHIIDIVTKPQ
ncbi:DNA-directed RNA polymerase subunit beta [Virgibacillus sp. C22-A2]|uniref:DNA-directed RNA polymerase subunit beta n=1 Tax=Virgibacillus tibetensis TaxID=3042313 RepID=A0ABU6KH30_9BACI|nr:DNA-directed RNA polymerase subunit beta [Virgibacillus sp. C22-A2]